MIKVVDGNSTVAGKTIRDVNYLGGSVLNIYYELQKDTRYYIVITKDVMRNQDAVEE